MGKSYEGREQLAIKVNKNFKLFRTVLKKVFAATSKREKTSFAPVLSSRWRDFREFKQLLRLRLRVRHKTIGFNEQGNDLHVRFAF